MHLFFVHSDCEDTMARIDADIQANPPQTASTKFFSLRVHFTSQVTLPPKEKREENHIGPDLDW